MNQELRLQLLLLVAFNGRRRVLEELAQVEDVDLVTVERELEKIRGKGVPRQAGKRKTGRRKSGDELMREVALGEDVHATVERLVFAYEEKAFLPDLWRVRQFLEAHGIDATKARSRSDALPKVVRVLASLTCDELERLAAQSHDGRSDLSILTDQILGPARGRAQTEPSRPTSMKRTRPGATGGSV